MKALFVQMYGNENTFDFQIQELEMFFNLISNCKEYCEKELVDEIKLRLVDRFKYLFPKEDRLNLNQIAITLETFFNL